MYDNWNVLIAEDDGDIAGWIGWTVKQDPIRKSKYAYLAEVVVRPESPGKGVATTLVSEAEKDAKEHGADHIDCYIYEPNRASKSLFPDLGYSEMVPIQQCAVSVYRKAETRKSLP